MKCFLCIQQFPSVKLLILHLRYKHSFQDGPIKCMEDDCYRDCTNTNSFRKHCREKHNSQSCPEQTIASNIDHNNDELPQISVPTKKKIK